MDRRRPRFCRVSASIPFQLTDRDVETVRQVASHRFLRSSHLARLLSAPHKKICERLTSLFHAGYLDRPRSQLQYHVRGGGSQHYVLDHYANSTRAYELFLDKQMQYTCGYFKQKGAESLDEAQVAKFHLIEELARKHFRSLAGKDHLDIGSGWGGMLAYFERTFKTRSVGNTNRVEQMAYAKSRFGSEVIYSDFSYLPTIGRSHDLITIVGMIEHLTPRRRTVLLDIVRRTLKKEGVVYLQCIVKPTIWIGGDAYRFVQEEVFPGHYLETAAQTEQRLADSGFTILERFDHGQDYGLTKLRWVEGLERYQAEVTTLLGARQYRMYLGYLAFASRMFSTGRGSLMRYVLKRR